MPKKQIKKYWIPAFAGITMSFLLIPKKSSAICAMCTLTTCAGIGISRWLGIDDLITGIWLGGFLASMVIITYNYLDKKRIYFVLRDIVIAVLFYSIIIGGLYFTKTIGNPANTFCCIDKLLFGITVGSIILVLSNLAYQIIKKKNDGKPHFPYQKVFIPISALLITSLIFQIFGC